MMNLEDIVNTDKVMEDPWHNYDPQYNPLPYDMTPRSDHVIDPQLQPAGGDQEPEIDDLYGDIPEEQGFLDDTTGMPLEVSEFVLGNLPFDEDFIGYAESFRELQATTHRRWRSTPFGVVLSPPRTGSSALIIPALSPPASRRSFYTNISSSFGTRDDESDLERTPLSTNDLSSPLTGQNPQLSASPATQEIGQEQILQTEAIRVGGNIRAIQEIDGSYVVKLGGGRLHPAVLFSHIYPQNETDNITNYPLSQQGWTSERGNGRPLILFEYHPSHSFRDQMRRVLDERAQKRSSKFTYEPWLDTHGRIILNTDLKPMRYFPELPNMISTKVEGWYLESLFRLNPFISHDDIIDRMPNAEDLVRPSYRALHQRRARARHIMRITNWQPHVKADDFWEHIIEDDMQDWARLLNSTYHLIDLNMAEFVLLEDLSSNPEPDPRKDKQAILGRLREILGRALRAGYSEDYWAIVDMKKRIEAWEAL